ncbi:hypothetical protein QTA58_22550 [Neorhizobium sp. CSC1952]|uniref:hypothetical protein n=1 Tax=Neorhizobium sp. CSC1952 TaxID=2978974 RepID=UPI0025A6313E|nr:hypothetical protein [Rhizobium sp. CSC1952]WJR66935.1 hypothetical protein QTA58_22550 [Rhizobium sp. CSC1952]
MTELHMGNDYEGVQSIKITKGTIDPTNTPDSQVSAFYYNSKWAKDIKVDSIKNFTIQATSIYTPSGAGPNTYTSAYYDQFNQTLWFVRNTFFPTLPYVLPVFDVKIRRKADNKFVELNRSRTQGQPDNFGREPGYYETIDRGAHVWFQDMPSVGGAPGGPLDQYFGRPGNGLYLPQVTAGLAAADYDKVVVLWRFPGDEEDILDGEERAPVVGQLTFDISNTACRVAKPGYDVRFATPTQLAFDTSSRPASVIAGDDIALPLGQTVYELGFPVNINTVCDLFLYEQEIVFPMSQYGSSLVVEYWFSGTKLYVNNLVKACRMRFIVIAFDDVPPSSGTNDVLRHFNDGTQDVVQFLRPGSGNPPRFSDIFLDSRWPCLQVLAQGYQSIASQPNRVPPGDVNPGQSFTVPFNSAGLFPIVKYMTVHQHPTLGKCCRPPQTRITENYNNSTRYHQGNSTFCVLSGNAATFWTFKGNPSFERWTSEWEFDYPPDPIIGIRYYILGIPTP